MCVGALERDIALYLLQNIWAWIFRGELNKVGPIVLTCLPHAHTSQDAVNGDSEGLWACMDVPVRNYQSYIPSPVNTNTKRATSPVMESPDQMGQVC